MIQDYEIKDGIVIAHDDSIGVINYEYQDNIDDILIQENIIEQINNDLDLTHTNILSLNDKINKYYIKIDILDKISFIGLCVSILSISVALLNFIVALIFFLTGIMSAFIAHCIIDDPETKVKEFKREINALQLQEKQLNNLLSIQKEKLKNLKNNKTNNTNIIKNKHFKSENRKKLDDIIHLKELYYTIGYYIKELKKYYEEGTLRNNLEYTVFNDKDLEIIETLISEEDPQFTKIKHI